MGRPKLKEKACGQCGKVMPATREFFPWRNKARGWVSKWCIECFAAHKKEKANRKRSNHLQRIRRQANKAQVNKAQRIRRQAQRVSKPCSCVICSGETTAPQARYCPACREAVKREMKRIDKAIRKSRLRKAMPAWADPTAIKEFYANRPEDHHVDHIIPIAGQTVSGLHVVENLQYLPGEENMKKSNRFELGG